MASERAKGRLFLLAALAVVLITLLITIWPRGSADTTGSSADRPRDPAAMEADPAIPPPLGLEEMNAQRVAPANRRDLFRFGSAQPLPLEERPEGQPDGAPARRPAAAPAPDTAVVPEVPSGPPPPAPIPLRYVGYAETPGTGKVAALAYGRFVHHGREGDVIEGRWRVVQIGVESLVIERVDGTGRQTLRLQ